MSKKLLVACERSQVVTKAFRDLGYEAFSCDILPSYGSLPGFHILGDAISVLESSSWDFVIAHPPCTYLTKASACRLFDSDGNIKDYSRYLKGLKARDFFMKFFNLSIPFVIENPVPLSIFNLPAYSQRINPYDFGDPYTKDTCLWLHKLPILFASDRCIPGSSWTDLHRSSKIRSQTFPGIARAFASQYSYVLEAA